MRLIRKNKEQVKYHIFIEMSSRRNKATSFCTLDVEGNKKKTEIKM